MPFVDEISEERSTVSTVSSVTAQTRQRVSSIKIRYKLAVKSDSPLILYSANFRYKIANFLRGRWDTGQEGDERRERKMVARTGDKNFAGGKKGGATGTQNAGSANAFLGKQMRQEACKIGMHWAESTVSRQRNRSVRSDVPRRIIVGNALCCSGEILYKQKVNNEHSLTVQLVRGREYYKMELWYIRQPWLVYHKLLLGLCDVVAETIIQLFLYYWKPQKKAQ